MKTIGLLGGMSWESTSVYYRMINELVKEKLGGLHSAKCLICSVDFAEIEECQRAGEWEKAADILAREAQKLQQAGAECLVICTNTMHKVADHIQEAISIPLLHIGDTTAEKIRARGVNRVGLLGTKYTLEQDFYKERLRRYGLEVIIPRPDDIETVNRIIYEELCLGKVLPESKREYLRVIDDMVERGAEGIILGCTEITLLIGQEDTPLPVFDTTFLHAERAVEFALSGVDAASQKGMKIF
ncbi:aspartate/glutamate racemase family protein [Brevibacillus sp. SYP-B805]|uniref:aspartate/glutamate racemase family protein n=1 Tax=Brevibacillus sp. SYP-B805 TaxID=1578199 RepID=UPI0013EBD3D9|nr:aspartate/glutamate racemase family protein [Brevibacillus sp. SYP-B805]NGQ97425.1 aspartate/glutamate racemase family protein [Brevibacillus sp. SYP-B805]